MKTNKELEKELVNIVEDLRDFYYQNYPNGDYLEINFTEGYIDITNEHWKGGNDENFPIKFHGQCQIQEEE